jgi:hypothetical protein
MLVRVMEWKDSHLVSLAENMNSYSKLHSNCRTQRHFCNSQIGYAVTRVAALVPLLPPPAGVKSIDGCITHDQCTASRTGHCLILSHICMLSSRGENSEYVNETGKKKQMISPK